MVLFRYEEIYNGSAVYMVGDNVAVLIYHRIYAACWVVWSSGYIESSIFDEKNGTLKVIDYVTNR